MKVQLLYFAGCPHVDAARRVLHAALAAAGAGDTAVEEFDVEAASTPAEFRGWGSPTILIDGLDLEGQPRPTGLSCRLYPGPTGVPSENFIEQRLRRALGKD